MVGISATIILCDTFLGMDNINHSAVVFNTINIVTNASIAILCQFVVSGIVSIDNVLATADVFGS